MHKIVSLVSKFLERSDLLNLAFTNSSIYKILELQLYSDLVISCWDGLRRLIIQINSTPNICLQIKKLYFCGSCVESLVIGDLDYLLSKCISLEEFHLENGFHLSNQLIKSLSMHNPGLRIVFIKYLMIRFIFLVVQSLINASQCYLYFQG